MCSMFHPELQNMLRFDDEDDDNVLIALEDLDLTLRGLRPPADLSPDVDVDSDQPTDDEIDAQSRDLTRSAVWIVSTAKPGNGVEQILDENPKTYWQSDGPQPHTISAQFSSKVKISEVQLYLNCDIDESYTPTVLSIRAGSNFQDLKLVRKIGTLQNPRGWVRIPMGELMDSMDYYSDEDSSDAELQDELNEEEEEARLTRRAAREERRVRKHAERSRQLEASQRRLQDSVNGHLEAMQDRSITKAHMIQIVINCNHQNGRDSHIRMVRVIGPKNQVFSSNPTFTTTEFNMYTTIR